MKLVIINYGAGNIKSIQFAFNRFGVDAVLSHNPEEILAADKIIFPGVGEASTAMKMLKSKLAEKREQEKMAEINMIPTRLTLKQLVAMHSF